MYELSLSHTEVSMCLQAPELWQRIPGRAAPAGHAALLLLSPALWPGWSFAAWLDAWHHVLCEFNTITKNNDKNTFLLSKTHNLSVSAGKIYFDCLKNGLQAMLSFLVPSHEVHELLKAKQPKLMLPRKTELIFTVNKSIKKAFTQEL